jgi:GMP synthase (glutamine-hydrolysing)
MHLHYLQHVPFEDPAHILVWAQNQGHSLSHTRLHKREQLPAPGKFDLLVIMGGPMNIYEYEKHPWLAREKEFIKESIDAGKKVLGICLGAQLIADVLGARVSRGPYKEIGWFPVQLNREAESLPAFKGFPNEFTAFHWHGDVFQIPEAAVHAASSIACSNQAFVYGEQVIALQFHLESTVESVKKLVDNCGNEITKGEFMQKGDEIVNGCARHVPVANGLMEQLLKDWK